MLVPVDTADLGNGTAVVTTGTRIAECSPGITANSVNGREKGGFMTKGVKQFCDIF